MKIRLEITTDNGTTRVDEINGRPTPEDILGLVNKLLTLQNAPAPDNNSILQQLQVQSKQENSVQLTQRDSARGPSHTLRMVEEEYSQMKNESLTIKDRLEMFLKFEYQDQWFTSLEVKKDYDRIYASINLSTVSTYLSRLYREGKLERIGNRNQRKYRIKHIQELQDYPSETVKFQSIRY